MKILFLAAALGLMTQAEDAPAIKIGDKAPSFTLTDALGKTHSLSEYTEARKTVVLEWFNPDCPVTRSYHDADHRMRETARAYREKGVVWLAINSSAEGREGSGLERNRRALDEYEIDYPVLLDIDGAVGKKYQAKTTPHMFVISPKGTIAYMGAIDDGGGKAKGERNHVSTALEELIANKPVSMPQTEPFGCSVKYAIAK